jgi:Icc-related predicted phosphoesterase
MMAGSGAAPGSADPGGAVTVGVAGDWHGNKKWAVHAVEELRRAGAAEIWHLGDFGLWPGGYLYLDAVEAACAEHGMQILVTPGNHEDYSKIAAFPELTRVREHITFLPRGHRFTVSGWRVLSFGGAASIDFEIRVENATWWRAEMPAEEEIDAAIAAGPCDILLVHESPNAPYATAPVRNIIESNPGWTDRALAYAAVGRERISRLHAGVTPRLTLHGHYHVPGALTHRDGTQVASLACDGVQFNFGLLRLPPRGEATAGGPAGSAEDGPVFKFLADPPPRE